MFLLENKVSHAITDEEFELLKVGDTILLLYLDAFS
jgi:hypothetical protein